MSLSVSCLFVTGRELAVCFDCRAIKVGRPTALGGQQGLASLGSSTPLVNTAVGGKSVGLNAAEAGQMAAAMLLGRAEGVGAYDAQNRVYVGSIPYTFTAEDMKVKLYY